MAAQTRQELRDFLSSYDTNDSGNFNRDRWLHLCTSATINLPQDSAAALFDRLDTDRDGLVTIDELLKSLSEWQKTTNQEFDDIWEEETGRPVDLGRFTEPQTWNSQQHVNNRLDSLYTSSPTEADKEFGKSVVEATRLSKTISDSYPELAAAFNHLLESFKKDILAKKYENADLEQSYQREKQARKDDLLRLENELETQIEMVEARIREELSKKYEAAYVEKVRQKELEIQRFRETVNELKEQVQTNHRKRSSISGLRSLNATTLGDDSVFGRRRAWKGKSQESVEESNSMEAQLQHEAEDLRKKLVEAQKQLRDSEAELTQLRATVETQSSQLHIEKMRSSAYIEEKDILYGQIQKLKDALHEVQGKHALYLQGEFLDRALDLQGLPWQRDSGQWSGSNEYSDRPFNNMDPEMGSVTNWSNVDGFQAPDRIFRVVMVGESSVGKTCFMYRFCTGDFYYNARATVGVDFKTKVMVIDGNVYTIELWDTAGQEKYHSLARQYFRKCDGAILMYDVSSWASFVGVREWVSMLEESCGDSFIPRILVGNKTDLRDSPANSVKPAAPAFISTREGENLAKVYKAEFIETSVLNGINIDEVIVSLARAMKYRNDCQNSGIRISKKKKIKVLECCS
ncbi:ras and EF hand domain containing protein [Echinococcus multilocularis]|uniref:Ras and EF hand domain containing protein n=1 Tax=Echinococcus multilocularis TaxID=6211 RepID=A0A068YDU6_ECHMU|nr:ras and EF hand domain containing protein [Echinococcus multilocularis]